MVYLKEIIEITGENLVNGNLEQKNYTLFHCK